MSEASGIDVDVTDPAILVRINQLYHADMTPLELYEATRGIWKVGGPRRSRVKYALAVFEGVVREVYSVDGWAPAGSSRYDTREFEPDDIIDRWEFTGAVAAPDVRSRYIGRSVAHYFRSGNSNPVMYRNLGD
jgi:uncharacterized protein